ncbi:2-C-methyl-D-erythritol 4-phosphate cytidylyltransferase [Runella salmonicolor]|uniref:2-C-methyl-D-erythritol 4-phosphate cytidylyltransferase n=1 Tax=Runella salmonicolor TaxID=2950278 RepID=A0ABT1FQQ8_9BACT|nr:2-C-methyl-D-erythritol 4-phosphate cytidylyltransferase [Runella salmonicolor]MCP1383810.1 2-C-methyl-D-erythritol 4-phosphate cytidylyltransferase [Runella salmonicolor]
MTKFAIIVAGGNGTRMGSKTPKQFMLVRGKPILMHTIEKFIAYDFSLQILLVLPANEMKAWYALCDKHGFYPAIVTVAGGNTRFQSVKNGLKKISAKEGLVAVHDGVRPFVSPSIIAQSFEVAAQKGTAITAVSPKDSIRFVDADGANHSVDRAAYRLVQTPQTFRLDWMRPAFDTPEQPSFTDCASVLEHAGHPITLIEGGYENIKITTPEDLLWAEAFAAQPEE